MPRQCDTEPKYGLSDCIVVFTGVTCTTIKGRAAGSHCNDSPTVTFLAASSRDVVVVILKYKIFNLKSRQVVKDT